MKLRVRLLPLVAILRGSPRAGAFSLRKPSSAHRPPSSLASAALEAPAGDAAPSAAAIPPRRSHALGLLTFDLDDSLYPIAPVLHDANRVFSETMRHYGYEDVRAEDIVEAGKEIRREAGPVAGAALSHTEVRLLAIRRELERAMLAQKLRECAEDWATEVGSLAAPVRESAARWARAAVAPTVVESLYSAWERERHHSAERHLYPEALAALTEVRRRHPDVVVGAVTDGKADPMLMVFSLAPHFDFCLSWEDDAAGRTTFFKELGNVDGSADLRWIYEAAQERYRDLVATRRALRPTGAAAEEAEGAAAPLWIHVGDDLAYDVGGSAACGARTVWLDLDPEYGQTAKGRFAAGAAERLPAWSTALGGARREAMSVAAEGRVDRRVARLSLLPDAVDDILRGE